MIKVIIFLYVVIAMLYYLLTVWLFTSEIVLEDRKASQIDLFDGLTNIDVRRGAYKICKNNEILYFLLISICGLIGGFGLPIIIVFKIFKRG